MRERETQKNLRRAMKEDVEAVKVKVSACMYYMYVCISNMLLYISNWNLLEHFNQYLVQFFMPCVCVCAHTYCICNYPHVQLDGFREMEKRVRQDVRKRKDNFTELKQDTQMEIARLTEDKRESQRQLEAAREEYDCLKVLQTQQMTEYQQALDRETQVS